MTIIFAYTICNICENKGADQLRGYCAIDFTTYISYIVLSLYFLNPGSTVSSVGRVTVADSWSQGRQFESQQRRGVVSSSSFLSTGSAQENIPT